MVTSPLPLIQADIKKQKCGSPFHLANVSGPIPVVAGVEVLWLSEVTVDGWFDQILFIYVLVDGRWFLFRDHYEAGLARRVSRVCVPVRRDSDDIHKGPLRVLHAGPSSRELSSTSCSQAWGPGRGG